MKDGSSKCEKCSTDHFRQYGSGRFCSAKCARSFSTADKRQDINEAVSRKLKGKLPSGYSEMSTDASRLKAARSLRRKSEARPFDEVSLDLKRRRVISDQNGCCNHCGLNEWRGRPLTLELEHIDGDNTNNDRSNLECLCPNCHSLTDTWRGRNKKTKRVSDDQFVAALRESASIYQALVSLGVAPKGGNYKRANALLEKHGITFSRKWRTASDSNRDQRGKSP